MKVIFLDIDGVLNTHDYLIATQAAQTFDAGGKITRWNHEEDMDRVLVARVNRIIEATGAKVVISSSWRLLFQLDDIRGFLTSRGFVGEIIGETPRYVHKEDWTSGRIDHRADEIRAWLREDGGAVESYVILDDDHEEIGESFGDRYVRTDGDLGLTEELTSRAIDVLQWKEMKVSNA